MQNVNKEYKVEIDGDGKYTLLDTGSNLSCITTYKT